MPCMRRHVGTRVPRSQRRTTDGLTRSARAMSATPRPWILRTAVRYLGTVRMSALSVRARAMSPGGHAPDRPAARQAAHMPLDERVGTRQQRFVRRMPLDHVREIPEVVDEELDRPRAPLGALHYLPQVDHQILERGVLDVDTPS